MQDILHTLGELMLGSIPTICLFLLLLIAYAFLVRRPLGKTLADRHARTGGAMDEAQKAIAASEARTAEYESKLREARGRIFEAQQARQKQAAEARDHALAEAHNAAQRRIDAAREAVERSGVKARQQIESGTESLSQQILAVILSRRPEQSQDTLPASQTGAQL